MRMTKNMGLVMALTNVYVEYCCDTGCTTVRNQKKTAKKKAPGIRFQQPTRMDYPLSYRCVDTWALLQ